MYRFVFIYFILIILTLLNFCHIQGFNLCYIIWESLFYSHISLYLIGTIMLKVVTIIIKGSRSYIIKVWLQKNYSSCVLCKIILICLSILFVHFTSSTIFFYFATVRELGLIPVLIDFVCSVTLVFGLFCYVLMSIINNNMYKSSLLLIVLFVGFFIPYVLDSDVYVFDIALLITYEGHQELVRNLVFNLLIEFTVYKKFGPFLFWSIFWCELLWIVYFLSLRFDNTFTNVTKLKIMLGLLGLTVNMIAAMYFFHPFFHLVTVDSLSNAYLLWFILILNITVLF